MAYTLRPAAESDDPRIKDLIRRVSINPTRLNWQRFIVAETPEGELAGCVQLKPHRDGSLELASLAVEETQRGQGVARLLIERLLAESPRPLYLVCRPPLGPLYEKFGFKVITDEPVSPFFRRIRFLFKAVRFLTGEQQGLIMRLDSRSSP